MSGVFVPWAAYQFYGDSAIHRRAVPTRPPAGSTSVHSKNPGPALEANSRGSDYGDWLNADTLKLGRLARRRARRSPAT